MPTYHLTAPNGRTYSIPGPPGLSQDVVYAHVLKYDPDAAKAPPAPETGVGAAFESGLENLYTSGRAGLKGAFGDTQGAAEEALAAQQEQGKKYDPQIGLGRVADAYNAPEGGIMAAGKELVGQFPRALAQSAPEMATTMGGAKVGAMLGRPFGLPGQVVGGLLGGIGAGMLPQTGRNLATQQETHPGDVSYAKAAGAGAAQAGLESVAPLALMGSRVAGKIFGADVAAMVRKLGPEAAEEVAKRSLMAAAGRGAVVGGAGEATTEVMQQALERLQAGKNLLDSDAMAEYGAAAYGGALPGTAMGAAGHAWDRSGAKREVADTQAAAQAAADERAAAEQEAAAQAQEQAKQRQREDPKYIGEVEANYTAYEARKRELVAEKAALKAEKTDAGDAAAKAVNEQLLDFIQANKPLQVEFNEVVRPVRKAEAAALAEQEGIQGPPLPPGGPVPGSPEEIRANRIQTLQELIAEKEAAEPDLHEQLQATMRGVDPDAVDRVGAAWDTHRKELTGAQQELDKLAPEIKAKKEADALAAKTAEAENDALMTEWENFDPVVAQKKIDKLKAAHALGADASEWKKVSARQREIDRLQGMLDEAKPVLDAEAAAAHEHAIDKGLQANTAQQLAKHKAAFDADLAAEDAALTESLPTQDLAEANAAHLEDTFNKVFASKPRAVVLDALAAAGDENALFAKASMTAPRRGEGAAIVEQFERLPDDDRQETAKALQAHSQGVMSEIIADRDAARRGPGRDRSKLEELNDVIRQVAAWQKETRGRAHYLPEFYNVTEPYVKGVVAQARQIVGLGDAKRTPRAMTNQVLAALQKRLASTDDPRLTAAMQEVAVEGAEDDVGPQPRRATAEAPLTAEEKVQWKEWAQRKRAARAAMKAAGVTLKKHRKAADADIAEEAEDDTVDRAAVAKQMERRRAALAREPGKHVVPKGAMAPKVSDDVTLEDESQQGLLFTPARGTAEEPTPREALRQRIEKLLTQPRLPRTTRMTLERMADMLGGTQDIERVRQYAAKLRAKLEAQGLDEAEIAKRTKVTVPDVPQRVLEHITAAVENAERGVGFDNDKVKKTVVGRAAKKVVKSLSDLNDLKKGTLSVAESKPVPKTGVAYVAPDEEAAADAEGKRVRSTAGVRSGTKGLVARRELELEEVGSAGKDEGSQPDMFDTMFVGRTTPARFQTALGSTALPSTRTEVTLANYAGELRATVAAVRGTADALRQRIAGADDAQARLDTINGQEPYTDAEKTAAQRKRTELVEQLFEVSQTASRGKRFADAAEKRLEADREAKGVVPRAKERAKAISDAREQVATKVAKALRLQEEITKIDARMQATRDLGEKAALEQRVAQREADVTRLAELEKEIEHLDESAAERDTEVKQAKAKRAEVERKSPKVTEPLTELGGMPADAGFAGPVEAIRKRKIDEQRQREGTHVASEAERLVDMLHGDNVYATRYAAKPKVEQHAASIDHSSDAMDARTAKVLAVPGIDPKAIKRIVKQVKGQDSEHGITSVAGKMDKKRRELEGDVRRFQLANRGGVLNEKRQAYYDKAVAKRAALEQQIKNAANADARAALIKQQSDLDRHIAYIDRKRTTAKGSPEYQALAAKIAQHQFYLDMLEMQSAAIAAGQTPGVKKKVVQPKSTEVGVPEAATKIGEAKVLPATRMLIAAENRPHSVNKLESYTPTKAATDAAKAAQGASIAAEVKIAEKRDEKEAAGKPRKLTPLQTEKIVAGVTPPAADVSAETAKKQAGRAAALKPEQEAALLLTPDEKQTLTKRQQQVQKELAEQEARERNSSLKMSTDTTPTTAPDPAYAHMTTVGEAIKHAAEQGGEFERALVEALYPHVKDAPFRVVENGVAVPGGVPLALHGARGVQMTHKSKGQDGVWVKGASFKGEHGVQAETVLHEALHQGTARKIQLGNMKAAEGTPLAAAVKDLYALTNSVIARYKQALKDGTVSAELKKLAPYAFNDPRELVSYGLTNKTIQAFLKETPGVHNKTLWSSFVDTVRRILGLAKEHTSALADLIDITDRVLQAEVSPAARDAESQLVSRGLAHALPGAATPALDKFSKTLTSTPPARGIAGAKAFVKDANAGLAAEYAVADMRAPILKAMKAGAKKAFMQGMYYIRRADDRMAMMGASMSEGTLQLKKDAKGYYHIEASGKTAGQDVLKAIGKLPGATSEARFALAQAYMVAQRASRVGWEKLGWDTTAENQALGKAALAEANANPALKAQLENVRRVYNSYNQGMIQFLADTGALSKRTAADLLKDGDYVPFYRVQPNGAAELVMNENTHIRVGDLTTQKYLQALKGDDTKLMPLNEAIMRNTLLLTDMGLQNLAKTNIAYALQDMSVGANGKSLNPIHPVKQGKQIPAGKDIIKFRQDGAEYWQRITSAGTPFEGIPAEMLVQSLEGSHAVLTGMGRIAGEFSNWLRKGVTRTPAYLLRQLIRDPMSASFTAGIDRGPVMATLESMREFVSQYRGTSKTAEALLRKGITQSGIFNGTTDDMHKIALQLAGGDQNAWQKFMSGLDRAAMRADAATRVQVYNDTLKKTGSEMEAELAAMEMMNFTKRGANPTVQYATRVIPFMNAQIQALNVLAKAFRGTATMQEKLQIKQKFFKNAAGLAGFSLLYAAGMEDDPDYKNASAYERMNNFFVPNPFGGHAFKIPIPYEVGFIFKALPEMMLRGLQGKIDTTDWEAFRSSLFGIVPGGSSMGMPQMAAPVIRSVFNKDAFLNDIENAQQQALPKPMRSKEDTTETAKALSSFMDAVLPDSMVLSGPKAQELVRGYVGGMPIAILATVEQFLSNKALPERMASQNPIYGAFIAKDVGTGPQASAYAAAHEIEGVNKALANLREEDPEKAVEYMQEHTGAVAAKQAAAGFKEQMAGLRKQKQAIVQTEGMKPEIKREEINKLTALGNTLAQQFTQNMRALQANAR